MTCPKRQTPDEFWNELSREYREQQLKKSIEEFENDKTEYPPMTPEEIEKIVEHVTKKEGAA